MAIGDHYEVRVQQSLGGQRILNVFHYLATDATADASEIAAAFQQQVIPDWQDAVITQVEFQKLTVLNLTDPTDWKELALTETGNIAETGMTTFAAASISYRSESRAIGVGGKRFAGVPESADVGGFFDAAYEALLITLANALIAALFDFATGALEIAVPVIIKRATKPPNPGPIESAKLDSWYKPRLGSQVSRKIARNA